MWVCSSCYERLAREVPKNFPWSIPLKILFSGFILIFVGVVLLVVATFFSGASNVGVIVFIGPIPIILGAGPNSILAILIAVALTILGVILFWAFLKGKEKSRCVN